MARIVLVHGFTQTGRSWRAIAHELEDHGHEVATPDLPGHVGSPAMSIIDAATSLADAGGPAVYVGYSMGGRVCMRLALDHPEVTQGVVLLGATAGIEDEAARARRRAADDALAARVLEIGVPAFIDAWLAQPMFRDLPTDTVERDDRLRNTADGLAGALRLAGTGAQEPVWNRLAELGDRSVPMLLLAGERDAKFVALRDAMASCIGPSARAATIAGAGHAAHLEQPARFLALVRDWLES
jgi:2-succinyl-6-hydroxy-2,4-cyclohexadiene-1-carboxylate synthase